MDFQSDCHLLHEINWPQIFFSFFSTIIICFSYTNNLQSAFCPISWLILFHLIPLFCIFSFECDFFALNNYQMHTLENNHLDLSIFLLFSSRLLFQFKKNEEETNRPIANCLMPVIQFGCVSIHQKRLHNYLLSNGNDC